MLTGSGTLGLVAALALAAVFAAAGIAKLADPAGTRTALREFGAPGRLVGMLALLLPLAELAVAGFLVPGPTRVVGAVGALLLLGLFTAAIATTLAHGRRPDCHCFGQLHSSPAGWRALVRNGLLGALAVVLVVAELTNTGPAVGPAPLAALAGGLVAIGLAYALLSLIRSYGRVLLRLDLLERRLAEAGIEIEVSQEVGLEPGTPAPSVAEVDDLLARGAPVLLLFANRACAACRELEPSVAGWQRDHESVLTIDWTEDERVHAGFEVDATPSAVLIAPDGTVASRVAVGAGAIEALLERALDLEREAGLPIGAPSPPLRLPSLDGDEVTVGELGEEAILLFWNPGCGFCGSMRDDLLAWERTAAPGAPRLVVVSSGDEAATRAEGFSSTVALDPDFAAGAAFGAGGTPMAVLLDREGRVASSLAAGAVAVFALAGRHAGVASAPETPVAVEARS